MEKKKEKGLHRNQIIQQIAKSPHGDLTQYAPIIREAANTDPEFTAHLVSWDAAQGQVRDLHVAMPILTLSCSNFEDPIFVENSLAHLAKLSPRELVQAYMFAKGYVRNPDKKKGGWVRSTWPTYTGISGAVTLGHVGRMNTLDRLVQQYLRSREENWGYFLRTVMNFRRPLIKLYFLSHTMPSPEAKVVLYDKILPYGSGLEAVKDLAKMAPRDAAIAILDHKIPFLVINSALGNKAKDPLLLMAMIERMSPTEIQTNMVLLEKLGVKDHPETRSALDRAFEKVGRSKKTVLKTGRAAGAVKDKDLQEKLVSVQEKQVSNLKGVEGNWLLLVDKSGSMHQSIELGRHLAGFLAKVVKGKVWMIFFDSGPTYYDVTGATYEKIQQVTRHILANGNTSIGCGLLAAIQRKLDFDGIAVVSDGGHNTPPDFESIYKTYCQSVGKDIPVYYYHVAGDHNRFGSVCAQSGIDLHTFELGSTVDYYSIPALAQTMSTRVYGLVDEILESPLITVESVLKGEKSHYAI